MPTIPKTSIRNDLPYGMRSTALCKNDLGYLREAKFLVYRKCDLSLQSMHLRLRCPRFLSGLSAKQSLDVFLGAMHLLLYLLFDWFRFDNVADWSWQSPLELKKELKV